MQKSKMHNISKISAWAANQSLLWGGGKETAKYPNEGKWLNKLWSIKLYL